MYENPFDSAWVAVESPFEVLDRRNFRVDKSDIAEAGVSADWLGNANIYAGYNILFRNVDAADKNTYLKVWDKTYETPQGGGYNALKVAGLPNAELSKSTPLAILSAPALALLSDKFLCLNCPV